MRSSLAVGCVWLFAAAPAFAATTEVNVQAGIAVSPFLSSEPYLTRAGPRVDLDLAFATFGGGTFTPEMGAEL